MMNLECESKDSSVSVSIIRHVDNIVVPLLPMNKLPILTFLTSCALTGSISARGVQIPHILQIIHVGNIS